MAQEMLEETIQVLHETRAELRTIDGLDVLDHSLLENESVVGWDPLRLTIDVRGTGASGYRIAELARDLSNVNLELASDTVAVAVFGLGTGTPARARRLVDGSDHRGRGARNRSTEAEAGVRRAAAVGQDGDDARVTPSSVPRKWFRSAKPKAGSRPSRWRPTRPVSRTCCPARF